MLRTLPCLRKNLLRELNIMPQLHRSVISAQVFKQPYKAAISLRHQCMLPKLLLIRPSFYRTCSIQRQSAIQAIWAPLLMPFKQELQVSRRHWQRRKRQQILRSKRFRLNSRISAHLLKTFLMPLIKSQQQWIKRPRMPQLPELKNWKMMPTQGLLLYRRH